MDEDVLDLDTRRRIHARLAERPGSYLRELQRDLAMPMGMLEYHLGRLEKAGLVTVVHGDHKRFFPAEMDARDKRVLALLRQDACRRVVVHLLGHPGASHGEIHAATELLPSTLSYYLARLVDAGLATRRKEGRQTRYAVADPLRAERVLVQFRASFLDRVLDRFLESLEAVRLGRGSTTGAEEVGPP